MTTSIVWLRRDLRLHDHPALLAAAGEADRLAPLFVLDDALLEGDSAPNRVWFMLETLRELAADLERRGSRLHVRRGRPEAVVPAFAREVGAGAVHVSRDFAPYGRRRDEAIARSLDGIGVAFRRHTGVLVHEPESIATADGRWFSVYSPFRRAWDDRAIRALAAAPDHLPAPPDGVEAGSLPAAGEPGTEPTARIDLLPQPGEAAARERLAGWLDGGIAGYGRSRDQLDDPDGTSRLSQDLRFGLLSAAEVAARASGSGDGRRRFVAEISWRDFYGHVLWHEPTLLRESFRPEMDAAFGPGEPGLVDAWREGRTGYPVVDAAMRQLAASGWMHNRGRMGVASFLTKHLLIDRRVGEAHFWRHLVDGDPASNNGGWQWAASTGTDPQPFFRIFNPILQGKRFDPDGDFVRRWVPELESVPTSHVHEPWTMPADMQAATGCRIGANYPSPVVDHPAARARALEALAAAGAPGRRDALAADRRDARRRVPAGRE